MKYWFFVFFCVMQFNLPLHSMERSPSEEFTNTFELYSKFLEVKELNITKNEKNMKLLSYIKEKKINVDARDDRGQTLLYHAVESGSKGKDFIIFLLTQTNADKEIENELGMTPLDLAKKRGHFGIIEILEKK